MWKKKKEKKIIIIYLFFLKQITFSLNEIDNATLKILLINISYIYKYTNR